jgi:hypothetical protein
MFFFSCNFYEEAYRNSCRKFVVLLVKKNVYLFFLSLYFIYLAVGELEAGHTEHNLTECDHEILRKKTARLVIIKSLKKHGTPVITKYLSMARKTITK